MDFLSQIAHTPTRVSVDIPGTSITLHGITTGENVEPGKVSVLFDNTRRAAIVDAGRIK